MSRREPIDWDTIAFYVLIGAQILLLLILGPLLFAGAKDIIHEIKAPYVETV